MHPIINKIENEQMTKTFPDFGPGDTVKVHTRVIEGDKERVQIFSGVVIARNGGGLNQAFTVRRISFNEGVERVFQLYSPRIAEIEVIRKGKVRRAKLYYLRKRTGKAALFVKEAPRQPAGKKQDVEIVTTSEE